MAPASPDCVDIHSFGNIDNELDIGIIVVVRSARNLCRVSVLSFDLPGTANALLALPVVSYLNVLIRHSNVVCVCLQIFWSGHHSELDGTLVAECLVGPFSYRSNLLDGCDTVVGDQDL